MTAKNDSSNSPRGITRFSNRIAAILLLVFSAIFLLDPLGAVAQGKKPFPDLRIPGFLRNEHAIQALGDKLPEVAEWYGKDAEELKRPSHVCL